MGLTDSGGLLLTRLAFTLPSLCQSREDFRDKISRGCVGECGYSLNLVDDQDRRSNIKDTRMKDRYATLRRSSCTALGLIHRHASPARKEGSASCRVMTHRTLTTLS